MPVVKNYNCSNCGATIGNVTSASGQCEYCGTPFVVESIKNCQEFVRNEGVTSGVPFNASPQTLYSYIREFLTSDEAAPSDVLEVSKITSCRGICMPAYYYHYTGTSSFTCQTANNIKSTVSDGNGRTKTVTNTNWTPFNSPVYADVERIVSGNSECDEIIDDMYRDYQISTLVDAESLEIPVDIETIKFTRPANELLSKYVRPDIEVCFEQKAKQQLDGLDGYRNLSVMPGKIEKDRDEKLLVGLYNINVEYNGKDYPIYVSGDGNKVKYPDNAPTDAEKSAILNSLKQAKNSAESALSNNKKLIVVAFILALVCLLFMPTVINIIGVIAGIAVGVFLIVNKRPPLKTALEEAVSNLNNFQTNHKQTFIDFDSSGSLIQGAHKYLGV